MGEKVHGWYRAIFERHSRRSFSKSRIDEETLRSLSRLIEKLNEESDAARIALVREHDGSIFTGIRGGYGIIRGAPSYFAFIARLETVGAYERLGYLGEAVILEATRLGLGTCWVSGTFDAKAVVSDLTPDSNEKVVVVSPVGYSTKKYALNERMMSGLAGSSRRKPIEKLIIKDGKTDGELDFEKWPRWARNAVEAARNAPSAFNRQPWRFRYEENSLIVETESGGPELGKKSSAAPVSDVTVSDVNALGVKENGGNPDGLLGGKSVYSTLKRLDCGIALRHAAVGAEYTLGEQVYVDFLAPPRVGSISPK